MTDIGSTMDSFAKGARKMSRVLGEDQYLQKLRSLNRNDIKKLFSIFSANTKVLVMPVDYHLL